MYVSINKHPIHFQNCFSLVSALPGKGQKMFSNFKCLHKLHANVHLAGTALPVSYGLNGPSTDHAGTGCEKLGSFRTESEASLLL
jgi:hypothetical protein